MLTSTEAASARKFEVSLRDAVDSKQVDSFMDRVVQTLMHYERNGRLHPQGISADEVAGTIFHPSTGRGYNSNPVERLRLSALEAIRFYEGAISSGAAQSRTDSRIGRVNPLAPQATLAQSGQRGSAHYAQPENDFRPPGQNSPALSYPLDFDVPILEDTISVPIRRPEIAGSQPSAAAEPMLLTAEIAQVLYEAQPMHPYMIHQAAMGAEYEQSHFQVPVQRPVPATPAPHQTTSYTSTENPASTQKVATPPFPGTTQAATTNARNNAPTSLAASSAPTGNPHPASLQSAAEAPAAPQQNASNHNVAVDYRRYAQAIKPEREGTIQAPTVQRTFPSPSSPSSPGTPSFDAPAYGAQPFGSQAPQQRTQATRPDAPQSVPGTANSYVPRVAASTATVVRNSPSQRGSTAQKQTNENDELVAIDGAALLEQLNNIMRTKETLASRDPKSHSLHSTIRLTTGAGALEVTAVRLHSNGQIYLETKPSK